MRCADASTDSAPDVVAAHGDTTVSAQWNTQRVCEYRGMLAGDRCVESNLCGRPCPTIDLNEVKYWGVGTSFCQNGSGIIVIDRPLSYAACHAGPGTPARLARLLGRNRPKTTGRARIANLGEVGHILRTAPSPARIRRFVHRPPPIQPPAFRSILGGPRWQESRQSTAESGQSLAPWQTERFPAKMPLLRGSTGRSDRPIYRDCKSFFRNHLAPCGDGFDLRGRPAFQRLSYGCQGMDSPHKLVAIVMAAGKGTRSAAPNCLKC